MRKLQELGVERFYGSPLTLVELYSYISRNIDAIELPPELRDLAPTRERKVRIIVKGCVLELPSTNLRGKSEAVCRDHNNKKTRVEMIYYNFRS
jgi:hypothetical protein